MSRLQEIHDYLIKNDREEKDLLQLDKFSVYLSMEICEYAHRNQIRENGDLYLVHPCRCLGYYRHMVGIKENDPFCIDVDLMEKYDIPYNGIQELCLLHDVIEDTDFTMEDLKEIFDECKLLDHFNMYIEKPLDIITHIFY